MEYFLCIIHTNLSLRIEANRFVMGYTVSKHPNLIKLFIYLLLIQAMSFIGEYLQ